MSYVEATQIVCKYCGSPDIVKYGKFGDTQYFWCKKCNRKITGKDTLFKMRYPSNQIATALRLYYEGLSLDAIQEEFQQQFGIHVATSTIYEWIQEFTNEAIARADEFKPKIGDEWIADETAIVVRGKTHTGGKHDSYYWLFDIIDAKTRFLLATHISASRTIGDVKAVMSEAAKRAGKIPRVILTDKLRAYPDGIGITFNGQVKHIQTSPFVEVDHTNLIERFHGTLKDRIKVLRGFKSVNTAKQILDGWLIYYNFLRKHESLNNQSPVEHMNIGMPFTSWLDIVKNTKERVIKPEPQIIASPITYAFTNPEIRRQYFREAQQRHRAKGKQPKQPKPKKSISSSIISLRE